MKEKHANRCKAVLRFLFSHIGLCFLVFGYCVLGALIILHYELPREKEMVSKANESKCGIDQQRFELIERIQVAFANGTLKKDMIKKWLDEYHLDLTNKSDIRSAYRQIKTPCNGEFKYKWSMPSAVLFTVTTVAAIGKTSRSFFDINMMIHTCKVYSMLFQKYALLEHD